MNELETIGQLYIENRQIHAEYDKLLRVLDSVARGETPAKALEVDLAERRWAIVLSAEDLAPKKS